MLVEVVANKLTRLFCKEKKERVAHTHTRNAIPSSYQQPNAKPNKEATNLFFKENEMNEFLFSSSSLSTNAF